MRSGSDSDPEPTSSSPHTRLLLKIKAPNTRENDNKTGLQENPPADSGIEEIENPNLKPSSNPYMIPSPHANHTQPVIRPDEEEHYNKSANSTQRKSESATPRPGHEPNRKNAHANLSPTPEERAYSKAAGKPLPNPTSPMLNRRLSDAAERHGAGHIDLRGVNPIFVSDGAPSLRGASRTASLVGARPVDSGQKHKSNPAACDGPLAPKADTNAVLVNNDEDIDMNARPGTTGKGNGKAKDNQYRIDPGDFSMVDKTTPPVTSDVLPVYVPKNPEYVPVYLNLPVSIDLDGGLRALDDSHWSEERTDLEYLANYYEEKYHAVPHNDE